MLRNDLNCTNISDDFYYKMKEKYNNGSMVQKDYEDFCQWITNYNFTIDLYDQCFSNFANEHSLDPTTNVSGIDVRETNPDTSDKSPYYRDGCDNNYKYLCANITDGIPEYEKGYKETAMVQGLEVVVVRIRWAKSDMTNE